MKLPRSVWAVQALFAISTGLFAQGAIDGDCTFLRMEWDGSAETFWKITSPSGPSVSRLWFNSANSSTFCDAGRGKPRSVRIVPL